MKQSYELDDKYENDGSMTTLWTAFQISPEATQAAFVDMILSQRDAANLKPTLLDQIKHLDAAKKRTLLHNLIDLI